MQQYTQLFLTSARAKDEGYGKCSVFAFTSSIEGEGVSFVVESFGAEIARLTNQRTLIASADRLKHINIAHYSRVPKFCAQTDIPNLWTLIDEDYIEESDSSKSLSMNRKSLANYFEMTFSNLLTLRFAFDYVLLDCRSLNTSGDVSIIAPETDGIILVVEADSTKRDQIRAAKQSIETADGNLVGFILNKRQYPVPNWLYKRL